MLDPDTLDKVRQQIAACAAEEEQRLTEIRTEARRLKDNVQTLRPRTATSVSLVAADGGSNTLRFDPLLLQIVRVVNSQGRELFLDVITQNSDIAEISARVTAEGEDSALAVLMKDLGVSHVWELSPVIPTPKKQRETPRLVSPTWVLVYKDLCEWAALYRFVTQSAFGTNTLVVRDGLLRSKLFRDGLFIQMCKLMEQALERRKKRDHVTIWLVGIARHSKLVERYRLSLALENVFPSGEPAYVSVPQELADKTFQWAEYTRPPNEETDGEKPKFNYGSMHLVRFGKASGDPIWSVDLFWPQQDQAQQILGCLLQDAAVGFPVPYYPLCLQQAREHAQLAGLDLDILESCVYKALRDRLSPAERGVLDAMHLNPDPTRTRNESE